MSKSIDISLTKEIEKESIAVTMFMPYDEIFLDRYNGFSCTNTAFLVDGYEDCRIVTMVPAHKVPISAIPDIVISYALSNKFIFQRDKIEERKECFAHHDANNKKHFFHIKLPFKIDFDDLNNVCHMACKYLCPNGDAEISITVRQKYIPSEFIVMYENDQETQIEITIYENPVRNNKSQ